MQTDRVSTIFNEPSPNGEIAPAPQTPLPSVPAMPAGFEPPEPDEHVCPDARRGAELTEPHGGQAAPAPRSA